MLKYAIMSSREILRISKSVIINSKKISHTKSFIKTMELKMINWEVFLAYLDYSSKIKEI